MRGDRRSDLGFVVLVLLAVTCLAAIAASQWRSSDRAETLTARIDVQQELIDALAAQLDEAIDQGADVDPPEVVVEDVGGDAEVSPAGPPGARGEPGPAGAPGQTGETGERGPAGADGIDGVDGVDGASVTGAEGPSGATGEPGADGIGVSGAQGPTGATGPQGDQGAQGVPGDTGVAGLPGEPGTPGEPGPAGPAPSPEQIAASVAEYLTANPPAAGPPGADGRTPTELLCTLLEDATYACVVTAVQ